MQTSVDQLSCDVLGTNAIVHNTRRDVLNIREIVSDTASNVTVIKDLVESGNLASHTPNSKCYVNSRLCSNSLFKSLPLNRLRVSKTLPILSHNFNICALPLNLSMVNVTLMKLYCLYLYKQRRRCEQRYVLTSKMTKM